MSTTAKSHLIILVNGLWGSTNDWSNQVKALEDTPYFHHALLHASKANQHHNTFHGVDVCGQRLASEVLQLVEQNPQLSKISFIAHSFGGLITRYAVGILYNPHQGSIAGLRPCHIITMATPHLGTAASPGPSQLPVVTKINHLGIIPKRFVQQVAAVYGWTRIGKTGHHLFWSEQHSAPAPRILTAVLSVNRSSQVATQDAQSTNGLPHSQRPSWWSWGTAHSHEPHDHATASPLSLSKSAEQQPASDPMAENGSSEVAGTTGLDCGPGTNGTGLVQPLQPLQPPQPLQYEDHEKRHGSAGQHDIQPAQFGMHTSVDRGSADDALAEETQAMNQQVQILPQQAHTGPTAGQEGPPTSNEPAQSSAADTQVDNAHKHLPMLAFMLADWPEQSLHFLSGLASFATRTCYANSDCDHLVSWENCSLRSKHQLPRHPSRQDLRNAPGACIWHQDAAEAAFWPPGGPRLVNVDGASVLSSMPTGGVDEMQTWMLERLQQLPWRRVDVSFRLALFGSAHCNLQYNRWINYAGRPVVQHLAEQLQQMDTMLPPWPQ